MKLDVKAMAFTIGLVWGAAMLLAGVAYLIWDGYAEGFLDVMASVYPAQTSTTFQTNGLFMRTGFPDTDLRRAPILPTRLIASSPQAPRPPGALASEKRVIREACIQRQRLSSLPQRLRLR